MEEFNLEEENIDYRRWWIKIRDTWYIILLFGFIGIACGYLYTKFTNDKFELSALILAEEETGQVGLEEMFSSKIMGKKTNIMNHIGMLKSFSIIKQALITLNWKIYWYEETHFKKNDLYLNAPYKVKIETDFFNIPGVPIYIEEISKSSYRINVNEEVKIEGKKYKIQFDETANFGETFSNNFFNFILYRSNDQFRDQDNKYFFVFKDLNQLALEYQGNTAINAFDIESDLIHINLKGEQPTREADFINQLVDVYINFGLRKKNQASENTIQFIDRQLGGIVDSLQNAGDDFTNYRSRNRIVDLSQEAVLVIEQLKALEYEESMASMRYDYYKNLQQYLDDAKQMELMVAPSVVGITDPSLNGLVVKLSELYSKRSTLSSQLTEINPARISLENEIDYTKQILNENLKNLISNVNVELRNFEDRKRSLNSKLTTLPKTEQNLINYKRKFDINNELYTFLMQKSAEAAITKASNVPDIQVLDYASVETAKVLGPTKIIVLLIGLILGIGFFIGILIIQDLLKNTIAGIEEIKKKTKIPVLASISKNKNKSEIPIVNQPYSGVSESLRVLRTNLNFILPKQKGSVISIHSSEPGEGKTFISVNLASSIALNNKKVLLVGADLRKPRIDSFFNNSSATSIGLSNYIIKKSTFDEIVKETSLKNLFVVSPGTIPPNPSELLGSDQFLNFVSQAKKYFDVIIFDNAPAFVVTDPLIIGKLSDVNIFILRQHKTKTEYIKLINSLHDQKSLENIYLILNDVKNDGSGYSKMYNSTYGKYKGNNKIESIKIKEAVS